MSFAFVTVLFLLISIPGIALRRSYLTSRFSIDFITTNLVNEIIWAIIPAFILHTVAILIIEAVSAYRILIEDLGYLLLGGNDKDRVEQIFQNFHNYLLPIFLYNIGLTGFAVILGSTARNLIRGFSLDTHPYFSFLRFPNTWHYLFTGEYLNTERGRQYHKNIDFILVEVLTNVGGNGIIYSGILEDYYLSRTGGGLDRIIIKYPSKKEFSTTGGAEFREIPSNYFTIPYDKILNINISYYDMESAGGDAPGESLVLDDEARNAR